MRKRDVYAGFPTITTKNWFRVRDQFKLSLPKIVTPESVMTYLDVGDTRSANSNVVVSLKQMGLLDEFGIPTELAKRWRLDNEYPRVCRSIVDAVYPEEVRALVDSATFVRSDLEDWFIEQGFGKETARKMGRVFLMLREGDLKSEKYMKRTPRKRQADSSPLSSSISEIGLSDHGGIKGVGVDSEVGSIPVHIDLQIHISSDLSLDQIDAVFQSMAKHLYGKEK